MMRIAPTLLALIALLGFSFGAIAKAEKDARDGHDDSGDHRSKGADTEGVSEEEEYPNTLIFGFAHSFSLLKNRENPTGELPGRENLYGFVVGYERSLHPYVAIAIMKPFFFNRERVDSQLEIMVLGKYRKTSWEPFVGAGVLTSIRSFQTLRAEAEERPVEFVFGLHFVAGFKYFVTNHWGFSLELGYSFLPTSSIFAHEIGDSYTGVYSF